MDQDLRCELRVLDAMNAIVRLVDASYVMGGDEVQTFASDGVEFRFRQDAMVGARVPKGLVEELVATLRWVFLRYGMMEVTRAGLLLGGREAARFELTFPGIGG